MAKASVTEQFDCTAEQFYNIVSDYEKYPEFLNDVKSAKTVSREGDHKIVDYEISVIKTFKYTLKMTEMKPTSVSWTMVSADIFKDNVGSWQIRDLEGGRCEATYSLDVKFTLFVPGMIEKKVVQHNLPGMMNAYKNRVKELCG